MISEGKIMGQVLNKFFRLIDRDLDGVVTAEEIMEFISALSTAR